MSDAWTWDFDPDFEHVASGLPPEVITEVGRLAEQLVVLGDAASAAGRGPSHGGGLRTLDIFGGRGYFLYMAAEHLQLIVVVRVVWVH